MQGVDFSPILRQAGYLFLAFIVGWVIGFLDSNLRTSKKIRAAESKSESAVKEAKDKIALAEERLSLVATTVADDPGALRLKEENGKPSLELDGARVEPAALSADQKKRLIGLLTVIRPWLDGGAAPKVIARPAEPVPSAPQAATIAQALFPTPPAPVKLEERPITPLSIVGQIDAILQQRMVNTPLVKQSIRLQESREGGAEVIIGAQKYPSIEEVPDGEVKDAIRAAVAEWEKKYTPGL